MIDQTKYAARVGPQILEYYEGYFDIPFPLPKQDMIAIPDFSAGAMENWGLITYRCLSIYKRCANPHGNDDVFHECFLQGNSFAL